MKTKALAVMAVLALAFAGFIFVPAADAEEMDVAVNTEKGTMTLTINGFVASDDVAAIAGDLDGTIYKIALANDITLSFANMSEYDLIKPYIKAGYVQMPAATIADLGDEWADYVDAILAFVEDDDTQPNYVAYDDVNGWVGDVKTIVVVSTPAAVADAVADVIADKDAAIADKDARIAELEDIIASDDSAATIADLTSTNAQQAAQISALEKEVADLKEKNAAGDKPLWETGIGQCLIIIVAFLAIMVIWVLYRDGKLDRLFKKKDKAKEAPKE